MQTKEATVSAHVNQKLKKDSESILRGLGISQTDAPDNDDLLLPISRRQAVIDGFHDS